MKLLKLKVNWRWNGAEMCTTTTNAIHSI